jgi:phenylalanine-4-hydroxylase
MFAHKDFAEFS